MQLFNRMTVSRRLVTLVVLAAVYLPAFFSDYFETTQGYLANRLGGPGVMNVPFFVEMGTFYNSSYFFFHHNNNGNKRILYRTLGADKQRSPLSDSEFTGRPEPYSVIPTEKSKHTGEGKRTSSGGTGSAFRRD